MVAYQNIEKLTCRISVYIIYLLVTIIRSVFFIIQCLNRCFCFTGHWILWHVLKVDVSTRFLSEFWRLFFVSRNKKSEIFLKYGSEIEHQIQKFKFIYYKQERQRVVPMLQRASLKWKPKQICTNSMRTEHNCWILKWRRFQLL